MKSIFKHKNKIIISILLAMLILSVLLQVWTRLFFPTFNIALIRNTLAHKSEVTAIMEEAINPRSLTNKALQWLHFDVKIIYEYTPTCIVALAVLQGRAKSRAFYVFELNAIGNWQVVQGYENNDFLPTRPSNLDCTNQD